MLHNIHNTPSLVPRLTVQWPGNETRRKMSWRPWTAAAARLRHLKGHKRKLPEPITKWKIVRGDLVEVLCGKDRGRQGHVAVVARKLNKVIVQGLNTHIRVIQPSGDFPGGRIASEAPLHVSNVALVDPADGKPCRIKYMYTEDGEKVRVSKRSGKVIPKPPELRDRKDWKSRSGYAEGLQDTKAEDVAEKTYIPSLDNFQDEVAQVLSKTKNVPFPTSKSRLILRR